MNGIITPTVGTTASMKKDKPWHPSQCVQWVYARKQGDIVVYARTAEEALATIREYGFTCIDVNLIQRGVDELTDILKKEEIT